MRNACGSSSSDDVTVSVFVSPPRTISTEVEETEKVYCGMFCVTVTVVVLPVDACVSVMVAVRAAPDVFCVACRLSVLLAPDPDWDTVSHDEPVFDVIDIPRSDPSMLDLMVVVCVCALEFIVTELGEA